TMRAAGFSVLLVQDSSGRILSSGHFRNDYDRVVPAVPRTIASSAIHAAVLDARSADAPVRALAASAAFSVRGARYTVTGGASFDSTPVAALSAGPTVTAMLITGDAALPEGGLATITFPYLDEASSAGASSARIVLVPDTGPTLALKA